MVSSCCVPSAISMLVGSSDCWQPTLRGALINLGRMGFCFLSWAFIVGLTSMIIVFSEAVNVFPSSLVPYIGALALLHFLSGICLSFVLFSA